MKLSRLLAVGSTKTEEAHPPEPSPQLPGPRKINDTNNVIVVSDTHGGCKLAVCPKEGIPLDDGGRYMPSAIQCKLKDMWDVFWNEWVPFATRGERYVVVANGDLVEGVHHGATTPISNNKGDQRKVTMALFEPVVEKARGGFYVVRGTETHVGISADSEEGIARSLGAIPNDEGQYARWDLWKQVGDDKLIHCLHHVGTTGSSAYEATAVHKEMVEEYAEAARWRQQPPDVIVRSHRHRNIHIVIPVGTVGGQTSEASAIVCPAWQLKTPFAYKVPGARISTPQIGGIAIRYTDDQVLYCTSKVWAVARSRTE